MPDSLDTHEWVAGCQVPVTPEQIDAAPLGGSLRIVEETYTVVREYHCDWCGADYSPQIRDQRCAQRGITRRRSTDAARRIGAEQEVPGDHDWIAGAGVPITARQAQQIMARDSFMIQSRTWARAQRVYCNWCGQDYKNAIGTACGGEHQDHLIGGTPGERAKRKHRWLNPNDTALMQHYRFDGLS